MRIHKRTAVAVAATLIGSLTLIGAGAVTATAEETSVALPSSSFRDIVVDGVHDRVFVSDPTGGSIVVTDYTGAVVQQITAEEGAAGLVLSADSSKLYVALSTVGAIAEIDTATLTETNRYPTGADTSPQNLAMAGGKLWFGYTVDSNGGIGSLDVASPAPAATLVPSGRYWYYAPALASSPADPNVLVAGEEGVSPATLAVYDTAAAWPAEAHRTLLLLVAVDRVPQRLRGDGGRPEHRRRGEQPVRPPDRPPVGPVVERLPLELAIPERGGRGGRRNSGDGRRRRLRENLPPGLHLAGCSASTP